MDTVLEQLLESPKLNLFYAQLHRIVNEEQVRREQFYATLREDEKSEFAYWILDPNSERVEQYLLEGDAYQLAFKADNGVVASRAVAGFAVPVRAVFDERENLAVLGKMLAD